MLKIVCTGAGSLSLAVFIMGIGLAHFRAVPPMAGLLLCAIGGALGLAGLLLAAAVLAKHHAWAAAAVGLLGLVPLAFLATGVVNALRYPPVNDVSTDVTNPPGFEHAVRLPENAGRDMAFPVGNAAVIRQHYPRLEPLPLDIPPDEAFALALGEAERRTAWVITRRDPASRQFEGVAETVLFRWRDDFVVRVREAEGGSLLDMRSKSREGKSDLGANAARIADFLDAVRKAAPL